MPKIDIYRPQVNELDDAPLVFEVFETHLQRRWSGDLVEVSCDLLRELNILKGKEAILQNKLKELIDNA